MSICGLVAITGLIGVPTSFASTSARPQKSAHKPHGTLIVGFRNNLSAQFDPQTSTDGINLYSSPVFETLLDQSSSGSIKPDLATSWSVNVNRSVLTLMLRHGVKFQDGSTFNSAAVKASIIRGQTLPTSQVATSLSPITSMHIINPYEIAFDVRNNGAFSMETVLTGAPGVMVSPNASNDPSFEARPIGTGPWEISPASNPTSEMIYNAFPGYWNPAVQGVQTIEIQVLSNTAIKNALLSGSINLGNTGSQADSVALKQAGLEDLKTSSNANVQGLILNKEPTSPFANEKLRLALSYAINRQAIATAVYGTVAFQACRLDSQAFPQGSPSYDRSLQTIQYSPTKAKQLLAAAGKPNGFTFNVEGSSSSASQPAALAAIQQQLAAVGITMNITMQPTAALNADWAAGKFAAYFGGIIGQSTPEYLLGFNLGAFSEPKMARAIEGANRAANLNQLYTAYQTWSSLFQQTAYDVTICNQPADAFATQGVKGVTFQGSNLYIYKGVTVP